uniref:Uncharacterized protein n=1 Tax=Arundo donax TaxID=35708 RepID=A0A0A9EJM2_ARUDO
MSGTVKDSIEEYTLCDAILLSLVCMSASLSGPDCSSAQRSVHTFTLKSSPSA